MKQITRCTLGLLTAAVLTAGCQGGASKEEKRQAEQLIENTQRQKNYDRLLTLADSLEGTGALTQAKACYWRGYAYDRKKQADKAEDCWRQAMALSKDSKGEDGAIYVKSASHLANLLCINGNYEGTLQLAEPIIAQLEAQKRDTTSDYENLLIYVNCCRAAVRGGSEQEIENGFEQAYNKHLENIKKNRTDASYKNAIAGLINIAYYCVKFKKYQYALNYTRNFGDLLAEYEQRDGVSADYIDRQLGRYDIYKAVALQGLGQMDEANEVFEAFKETRFSQTPEGQVLAEEFLSRSEE